MRRRDLLLSLMAGTAGALLAPRRALVDGFDWYRDELPGQSRIRVVSMRFRGAELDAQLNARPHVGRDGSLMFESQPWPAPERWPSNRPPPANSLVVRYAGKVYVLRSGTAICGMGIDSVLGVGRDCDPEWLRGLFTRTKGRETLAGRQVALAALSLELRAAEPGHSAPARGPDVGAG